MTLIPPAECLETDDFRLSYREHGTGSQTLLCLQGGGPGATGWGNFGGNAVDLGDRYRVVVPDLPGFGESRIRRDPGGSYAELAARSLVPLMDELGVEAPVVIGNSMGGGVALALAALYPDRVGSLVLMGCWLPGVGFRIYSPEPNTLLEDYYEPKPSEQKMRAILEAMVYSPDFDGADELIRSRYERSLDAEIRLGYERANLGARPDFGGRDTYDVLRGIDHSTLLLWGRDDRFCSLDEAFLYMTLLRNADLTIFGETGHWVMIERRAEFAAYVDAFARLTTQNRAGR